MKFLQIGLGSMGKRRIRCLKTLGHQKIVGYDARADRRKETQTLYKVDIVASLREIQWSEIDAVIISTPPDRHLDYMKLAVAKGIPCFVEASVILAGLSKLNRAAKKKKVLIAPSCTLCFYDPIKEIRKIVASHRYGKFTNFTFHSGQYLPDWHPWEKVTDFYVSKKETGACREIVPFELTWIVDMLGLPKKIIGLYGRTMNVGVPIDDIYILGMKFSQGYGSLAVDVVSRYATRSLILNMERGQIVWRWDERYFRVYEADRKRWITVSQKKANAQRGYNKNIAETMYVDELRSFIDHISGKGRFPNTLTKDIKVLEILAAVERQNQ